MRNGLAWWFLLVIVSMTTIKGHKSMYFEVLVHYQSRGGVILVVVQHIFPQPVHCGGECSVRVCGRPSQG